MGQGSPLRAALYARQSRNKAKSIADQLAECRQDAESTGLEVVATYQDGRSASRYARTRRTDWPLVLAAVVRQDFDIIVLWEGSRGDRTLTTWSAFLDTCRDRGVLIRVVNDDRTYDMAKATDWDTLARAGVDSATESNKISTRTKRGVASAAKAGRPPSGPTPYGYRRVFDPATGALVGQEVDPSTSPIVREIIARVGRGEPVSTITRDLNARGILPPGGGPRWYRQRVRELAMSPIYAAKRAHRPGRGTGREGTRTVHDAAWPAIVSEAEHYTAARMLAEPVRLAGARPGRQVHLLSYLATCSVCSAGLIGKRRGVDLACPNGHLGISMSTVDEYVTAHVIGYLARPDVFQGLAQASDTADRDVMAARGQAAQLRARLDEWRASAAAGETSPASLAAIENDLTRQIHDADQRAIRSAIPAPLRFMMAGEDVAARWESAPLAAKRLVLAELVTVRIKPGGQRRLPVEERVVIIPAQLRN